MLSVLVSTVHMATVLAPREPTIRQKYHICVIVGVLAEHSECKHYYHIEHKDKHDLKNSKWDKAINFKEKKISVYWNGVAFRYFYSIYETSNNVGADLEWAI